MAIDRPLVFDTDVSTGLRFRGQFLLSVLLWGAAVGFLFILLSCSLVLNHYLIAIAVGLRMSFGLSTPVRSPDWFMVVASAAGPLLCVFCLLLLAGWYRRLWSRKLGLVWSEPRSRRRYSRWNTLPPRATAAQKRRRMEYLLALRKTECWDCIQRKGGGSDYESQAEWVLSELEKDVAERALTIGLTVGISQNRYFDLFTILAGALELQLHVLSRLGKRPSWHTWRLLLQNCGASLFINSYLNRQDALSLNLMIKKAGMGLYATGDLVEGAANHLSDSDFDLDEALNLQHAGFIGMATKSLELGATMALTVGQVGLHVLGALIESVGDELTQGALAGGIIYYHGMTLASDTLALDERHRQAPGMNRSFREGVWKMGEIAGSILRDLVRQRRTSFRDKRRQIVRSLPKSAYAGIQALFGKKAEGTGL